LELREAAGGAAAAEEGGDRREWPAGGGCHAATPARRKAVRRVGICICRAFSAFSFK
jgi:hypothetical protein